MEQSMTRVTKKNQVGLVLSLMAGYSMVYMDKLMVSTAILPIREQFGFSTAQAGMIMSFFFLGNSILQIPGGWLADKIGSKKTLMLSTALIGLFSLAFGSVSSLVLFMIIRFSAGIGHCGYPPGCSKAVADNFPKEKRTMVQSLMLSTSGIGGLLAATIGTSLININWRYGYMALGAMFAVSCLLIAIFVPEKQPVDSFVAESTGKKIKFKEVITNRNVIVLSVAMMLLNFIGHGNMSWLPTYLSTKFSVDLKTIGTVMAFNSVFTTIATMLVGVLLTKVFLGKERQFIVISSLVVAVLFFTFPFTNSIFAATVCNIAISVLFIGPFIAIFTWPHKIMDASIIGTAIGIINTGGMIGGFLGPMILGRVVDANGGSFFAVYIVLSIVTVICGLVVLGVKTKITE